MRPASGMAKSDAQELELSETAEPKLQQIHPMRNHNDVPKDNSLSAIKNQLDLTMS